jgi:hypothetical protein
MAANLEKIVEDLSALTVLEAAELSKLLEDKWGNGCRCCSGCCCCCRCCGCSG